MKTLKTASLVLRSGRERSYIIDIVDLARDTPKRYLVNFRYGFIGSELQEGTRTPDPVDLPTAERLFDSLIQSRRTQGYVDAGETAPWEDSGASGPQRCRARHHRPPLRAFALPPRKRGQHVG